ncbi:N-acetylmuramic acid 6-phosphate etherase [Sphingobium lactosutens]|jgi:N-acetylmuramic acid 6-phosphate etherase|uniref:N-acetylmuramic acid 6-phosphate etherase n=2 Tax=Sphingobium TaxID=165695 RepID=UPI000C50BF7B|nr:N-acetylmuramic acid 6-phosphate etherase [Sphingobium lactosutens]MBA37215.1 N-acetylmuramic acid 6-phosphate etherase [Sphingobium sp.]MBS49139.1 N-acetylmuramic acid 6-phosphate etherase [Sphingobium sp.]MCC4257119.1 N-acetylmuramic acid 6-phosphate etherase [Sphingobium lactosutens]
MSTEAIDPRYVDIDQWPTALAVEAMLEGQMAAIAAIGSQTMAIAQAAEAAAARLGSQGRLVYVGAGTSGRVAVQDGVELYPTYNWPEDRLLFLMAGGLDALTQAAEGAEDDAGAARAAVAASHIGPHDVVIGVAASGRTPFTCAAIAAAREAGALTVGVANNGATLLLEAADHGILAETGTEIIAGSTRMKAGTAQKAVLNILSTAIMLRMGLVYRGRMVNMRISNAKLRKRGEAMICDIAQVDQATAAQALDMAGQDIKLAVLIARGLDRQAAESLLAAHGDNLADAIGAAQGGA